MEGEISNIFKSRQLFLSPQNSHCLQNSAYAEKEEGRAERDRKSGSGSGRKGVDK
jgi:hypothetical protein